MRRRTRAGFRRLSAEDLVLAGRQAELEVAGLPNDLGRDHLNRRLAEHGYTVVDYFRARLWLRRGRPSNYVWDTPGNPIPMTAVEAAHSTAREVD